MSQYFNLPNRKHHFTKHLQYLFEEIGKYFI